MAIAMTFPIKQDWTPTGIKGDRYELYKNSDGVLSLCLDGKLLPYQQALSYHQQMYDVVIIKLKILLG